MTRSFPPSPSCCPRCPRPGGSSAAASPPSSLSKEEGPRNNSLSKRCRKCLWRKRTRGYILRKDYHGLLCLLKPPVKERTEPIDLVLHSDVRAVERVKFDQYVC
ncbi:uncharacterized protein LOC133895946 isoform X2 [Phragmites australis]|uniref:uncharacterized protein LOC133895946 isoform X2 n=1 Tax=Phragmites australis TaxID=29695 RepID=UPI002D77636B|nr:uncharacterized protein LOC133895946 isoform X2 [Phragmites australis]